MRVESVTPYGSGTGKREQIRRAFDAIAPGYDRMNRILSLGIDRSWRRKALALLDSLAPKRILDVATGTGDFALMAAKRFPGAQITGIDLSSAMLDRAREKAGRTGLSGSLRFLEADALDPPLGDERFDAVTVAYGVRNFERIADGLAALYERVSPGGALLILELTRPERFPMRQLHALYLRHWIPRVGRRLAGHAEEYRYLSASIAEMPQGEAMAALLQAAGFSHVMIKRYTFGVCTAYLAGRG